MYPFEFIQLDKTAGNSLMTDGLARRFWREDNEVKFDKEPGTYDMSAFKSLEVKAGTLVLLHGNLVHQRSI